MSKPGKDKRKTKKNYRPIFPLKQMQKFPTQIKNTFKTIIYHDQVDSTP